MVQKVAQMVTIPQFWQHCWERTKRLKFLIDHPQNGCSYFQIGWYSEDEGLHLNAGFELELVEKVDDNSPNAETSNVDTSKAAEMSKIDPSFVTERIAPVSSPLVVNSDRSVFGRSIGQVNLVKKLFSLFFVQAHDDALTFLQVPNQTSTYSTKAKNW